MLIHKVNADLLYEAPEGYEFSRRDLEIQDVTEEQEINCLSVDDLGGMTVADIIETFKDCATDHPVDQVKAHLVYNDREERQEMTFHPVRKERPDEYYRRLERIRVDAMSAQERNKMFEERDRINYEAMARIRERSIRNQLKELGEDPDKLEKQ